MKLIYTFIIALFAMPLFSQQFQRIITDYNGISTNGKAVVCYGDYGIITTSQDYGMTWKQTSIGDKYSIKKILTIGNDFIGVTDYCLIKSIDNGRTWSKAPEVSGSPQIIDMAQSGNTLYILQKSGIWTAGADLNLSVQPLLVLDTTSAYTEMKADGENIYILLDKRYILSYSIASKNSIKTDIINIVDIFCHNCHISDLQLSDGKIYSLLNQDEGSGMFGQKLLQSGDKGKTWKHISPYLFDGNTYKVENGEIYYVRPKPGYLFTEYYTVDSTHYAVDSTYFTVINDKDSVEREMRLSSKERNMYTGIATIGKDTMIAVGANKLISISYDGGKSWQLRSFFYGSVSMVGSSDNAVFINENKAYIFNFTSLSTTNDGGSTWLPQKSTTDYSQVNSDPLAYFFNEKGKGYVRFGTIGKTDTNVFATDDYGDSYSKYDIDTLYSHFLPISPEGLNTGDIILYAGNPIITNGSTSKKTDYSLVLRYDESMHFLDSVRINANTIESMVAAPDGNIYSLVLKTSGENKADSAGNTKDYRYTYFMLRSTDKGQTWDSTATDIPIRQQLIYSSFSNTYRYSDILANRYGSVQGNYILYPAASGLIFRYNYKTTVFDSVRTPGRLSGKPTIFTFGTRLYAVSEANDVLYFTDAKNFGSNTATWDSIACNAVFAGWENYDPLSSEYDRDAILSVQMFNDSTGFMLIGRSEPSISFGNFKLNVVKLSLRTGTTGITEANKGNNQIYLWNSPPYPLPGKNIIASRIYWDNRYNIDEATISVHDISGAELLFPKINIEKTQDYRGLLQWDCANMESGIYIIKVSLAGEALTIPVMIAR